MNDIEMSFSKVKKQFEHTEIVKMDSLEKLTEMALTLEDECKILESYNNIAELAVKQEQSNILNEFLGKILQEEERANEILADLKAEYLRANLRVTKSPQKQIIPTFDLSTLTAEDFEDTPKKEVKVEPVVSDNSIKEESETNVNNIEDLVVEDFIIEEKPKKEIIYMSDIVDDNIQAKKRKPHKINKNEATEENNFTEPEDKDTLDRCKIINPSRMKQTKGFVIYGLCNPIQECLITSMFIDFINAIDILGNGRCFQKSLEDVMLKIYNYKKTETRTAVKDMDYYGLISTKKDRYGNLIIELTNPSLLYINAEFEHYPSVVVTGRTVYKLSKMTEEGMKKSIGRAYLYSTYNKIFYNLKNSHSINQQFDRSEKQEFFEIPLVGRELEMNLKSIAKRTTKTVRKVKKLWNTEIDYIFRLSEKNVEILFDANDNTATITYFDVNNTVTPKKIKEIICNDLKTYGINFKFICFCGNENKVRNAIKEMDLTKNAKNGNEVATTKREEIFSGNKNCTSLEFVNAGFDKFYASRGAKDMLSFITETDEEKLERLKGELAELTQKISCVDKK